MKFSQNSFGESHTQSLVRRKALKELLSQLVPSGLYLFKPFLMKKSQMGQTKNRSSEKSKFDINNLTSRSKIFEQVQNDKRTYKYRLV